MPSEALQHIRICDFTGQLAGAGATKFLAAFGAQIIRIEDPVRQGRWDILRGSPPYKPGQSGNECGGGFNNHNTHKLGITLNWKTDKGKELLRRLVAISDVVSENFASGVMKRMGFHYEDLRKIKSDIIYVSNCGFGHSGPYEPFKTWGPIVQAISGLTFTSGLPDMEPAGWGYSYMDHTGGYYMALSILLALHHRNRTGEGQWVDMACTEAGASLNGPAMLDYTVNGRPMRREGSPDSNRNTWPPQAPHGIYPSRGDDDWVSIACRDERDWEALCKVVGQGWTGEARFASLDARLASQDALDEALGAWTRERDKFEVQRALQAVGVPAAAVQKPQERIDQDPNVSAWGLFPTVKHSAMGDVRVDGIGAHLSKTDWALERGAACLGEHNEYVYGELLGLSTNEIAALREEQVL